MKKRIISLALALALAAGALPANALAQEPDANLGAQAETPAQTPAVQVEVSDFTELQSAIQDAESAN